MNPKFTIAIGSYNRQESLSRAIKAVFAQDFDEVFDLIVVLDGSTDDSEAFVKKLFSRAPSSVKTKLIVHRMNRGVGAVANSSLQASRTEYIVFFDDDCVPAPEYLKKYKNRWGNTRKDIVGIGGYVTAWETDTLNRRYLASSDPHRPTEWEYVSRPGLLRRVFLYFFPPRHLGFRPVFALVGGNMSFRREELLSVGGFDSETKLDGFEERASIRVRGRYGDKSIYADPEIVIAHDYHPNLRDTFSRAIRVGKSMGRNTLNLLTLPPLRLGSFTILASAAISSFFSWWIAISCLAIIPILIFRPLINLKKFETFLFPYIALLEESLKNLGFLITICRFLVSKVVQVLK